MVKDLKKYKRLFAFGCSFTNNIYPSYADVLAAECINAEFYNLGKSGGGNNLIAYRFAEANRRYNFTKDDLVVIMYTTFCREDRWVEHKWATYGNVFNNHFYDDTFLKKYADPNGYLIQNGAIISLLDSYIEKCDADCIQLTAWDFLSTEYLEMYDQQYVDRVYGLYGSLWSKLPTPYFRFVFPKIPKHVDDERSVYLEKGAIYKLHDGTLFGDAHPNSVQGYIYLESLGFPLTSISYDYAYKQREILQKCKTQEEISSTWKPDKNQYLIRDMFF